MQEETFTGFMIHFKKDRKHTYEYNKTPLYGRMILRTNFFTSDTASPIL
jgi:hypothetical protein